MATILPPYQENDRMLSGLAYPLWPFFCPLILLGFRREEPFVHFHALQALALGVLSLGAALLLFLASFLFLWLLPSSFITFSGVAGLTLFITLGFVLFFWLSFIIYLAWQASSGQFLRLPFVGKWAEEKMQLNLGIGPQDYETTIIGQRRGEREIDAFDYKRALESAAKAGDEYAQEELQGQRTQSLLDSEYTDDYQNVEYSQSQSGDIGSYLEPEPAPAPYKAPPGARPAASSGGFKPLAPERRAPAARPAPQPVVPPTAPVSSSEDEFKPLSVGRQSTPPAASGGLRFSEDFSRPKSGAPAPRPQAPPRPSAPPRPPQRQAPPAAPAPAASADFTPGIVNRPAKAPSRRTFQWEQLEEN